MLVTLKKILEICEKNGYAVGSFNTPNLESVLAVIRAAEELNVPVVLQHAQVHEELMPLSVIGPVMLDLAKKASVPVAVHVDHGETVEYISQALNLGFTSVMYDGSTLTFDENMKNTRKVAALAAETGASVEAEIGCMGKRETGTGSAEDDTEKVYTDPEDAERFVKLTGIDALACSFGTTHGVYIKEPKLDFSVVEKVRAKTGIPVVMHGGSGVSEADFRKAIKAGVRKINYYTYMALAGGTKVRAKMEQCPSQVMYHDIVGWGTAAMKENCREAMKVFSMKQE